MRRPARASTAANTAAAVDARAPGARHFPPPHAAPRSDGRARRDAAATPARARSPSSRQRGLEHGVPLREFDQLAAKRCVTLPLLFERELPPRVNDLALGVRQQGAESLAAEERVAIHDALLAGP